MLRDALLLHARNAVRAEDAKMRQLCSASAITMTRRLYTAEKVLDAVLADVDDDQY